MNKNSAVTPAPVAPVAPVAAPATPEFTPEEKFGLKKDPLPEEPKKPLIAERPEKPKSEKERRKMAISLFGAPEPKEDFLDEINSEITEFSLNSNGTLRLTLANGHVWQQLAGDKNKLHNPYSGFKPKPLKEEKFQTVRIKREALGSFRMYVEPLGESMKAKRLK